MARIHVCPLAHVGAVVDASGAGSVVSLLAHDYPLPRFAAMVTHRLRLAVADIAEPLDGHVLAGSADIDRLIRFLLAWDRQAPLLIHCYAGVSRSTAAAFIALCLLDPARSEMVHAHRLRRASPTATPNPRLVALADVALARGGRMADAIRAIGRGADCFEGKAFTLDIPAIAAGAEAAEIG